MAISGWHPRYRTGIAVLDEQHEAIFLTLARLKTAVAMRGEGEDVGDLLAFFDRLTQDHFRTEEEFLQLHGYPDLEAHRSEHRKAGANLEAIREQYAENTELQVDTIVSFVNGWLSHHIQEGDFKYVSFLKARGA